MPEATEPRGGQQEFWTLCFELTEFVMQLNSLEKIDLKLDLRFSLGCLVNTWFGLLPV